EQFRDASQALALARKATEHAPEVAIYWNTLGASQYRAGEWKDALVSLEEAMRLDSGGNARHWFLLAMAHHRLGNKPEALKWYRRAKDWTEKKAPKNDELRRFRAEAEALLMMAGSLKNPTRSA